MPAPEKQKRGTETNVRIHMTKYLHLGKSELENNNEKI